MNGDTAEWATSAAVWADNVVPLRGSRRAARDVVAAAERAGYVDEHDRLGKAMLALSVLRPVRRPVAPPDGIWALVRDVVERHEAENVVDLVVAIGCGWHRDADGEGWAGRWPAAVAEMVAMVRSVVVATGRQLETTLPSARLDADDRLELPGLFVLALLGQCDCGHHVRTCGRGRCGRGCCYPDHDLAHWDPEECHLRPFVEQAVRGSARGGLRGGEFAESMLYRLLEREGRVLRRKVEFQRCSACGTVFEGPLCANPDCRRHADDATVRIKRVNWLLTPVCAGGDHTEVVRRVCGGCSNLFRARGESVCPACGWRPDEGASVATVTVWTRVAPSSGSADGRRVPPRAAPW